MSINTKTISGRRELYYNTLDDLRADLEALAAGEIVSLGNWSPGRNMVHIARAMQMSVDGIDARAPWYLRLPARLMRDRIIRGPMRAGFKLPRQAEVLLVPGETSTEEGIAALRSAMDRIEREPPRAVHPLLGALTPQQWIRLHLTHAALHMSFLQPKSD